MSDLRNLTGQDWNQLFRLRLTLMVTASTAVGYLLVPHAPDALRGLLAIFSVACLCCGCTILNQIQERDLDARMLRTSDRPLASGKLSVARALEVTAALFLSGLGGLLLLEPMTFWLGLIAIIWYNGVYTPLKRLTSLAVLPGSLCGALPPLIGWRVGGGELADPAIVLVCSLLVLWQVPHFLLLVARYRDDYERAGLPVFVSAVGVAALRRILSLWLAAVSISFLLLPAFGVLQGSAFRGLVLILALALGGATWYLGREEQWGRLFIQLNLHMGLVLALLICDRFLSHLY